MGLFKKDPKKIYQQAIDLLHQGKSEEGLSLIQKAADMNYGPAWIYLGEQHEKEAGRQILQFDDMEDAAQEYEQAAACYRKAIQKGFPYGWKALGNLYDNNHLKNSDSFKALRCYERAAEAGISSAKTEIAKLNLLGITRVKDTQEAIRWYESAWQDGCPDAYIRIGELYEKGDGVPRDIEKAFTYYEKAAADTDKLSDKRTASMVSNIRLRCICRKHPERLGYEELVSAGQMEFHAKNYALACSLWERAAAISGEDLSAAESKEELSKKVTSSQKRPIAEFYLRSKRMAAVQKGTAVFDTAEEYVKNAIALRDEGYHAASFHYFSKAAEMGHPYARNAVATAFLNGRGVEKNEQRGQKLLLEAANAGSKEASYNLGLFYKTGQKGFPQDKTKALQYYKKAFDLGEISSGYYIGKMYRDGDGIPRDMNQACSWFTWAASLNHAESAYEMAWFYREKLQGTSLSSDLEKMMDYYTKAAELKHRSAQAELGSIYFSGSFGVKVNIQKAFDYLYPAALADHAAAQGNLAFLYFLEKYGKRNPEAAYYWSRRAAVSGDSQGQFVYAFLLGSGEVSKADEQKAREWLKKSADQGYEPAIEQLKRLK